MFELKRRGAASGVIKMAQCKGRSKAETKQASRCAKRMGGPGFDFGKGKRLKIARKGVEGGGKSFAAHSRLLSELSA